MTDVDRRSALPPLVEPAPRLDPEELDRYSRHVVLPQIGTTGQRRLKNARVLVVGAGGLGSPVLLYLAAAGVGTLGVVDDDRVEASNLQRQVIHGDRDIGRLKVDSARDALLAINPLVRVEPHPFRLTADTAAALVERYDLVVDGADNFATRYLISDTAALAGKPCVWGSVLRSGAQVSVFWSAHGPTYRDLYPDAPPPGSTPSCGEAGVLGMLCGVAGSMMAAEAVKLVTGTGRTLLGRLSIFDLGDARWRELRIDVDPARRPVAGSGPARTLPVVTAPPDDGPDAITAVWLREMLRERSAGRTSFELVDVREAEEQVLGQIPGSRSAPLSRLRADGGLAEIPAGCRIVLYCAVGARARAAAAILHAAGHSDVGVLEGGMEGWTAGAVCGPV